MTLAQLTTQMVEPLGWLLVHSVWHFAPIALAALKGLHNLQELNLVRVPGEPST